MSSEVGSGQVAIFPTFRGFRRQVSSEVDGAATASARGFSRGMSRAGTTAGQGFNRSFASSTRNVGQGSLASLKASVAKTSGQLATARLKEQDAAGKVRVAETALNEARTRGGATSARAIAAEERLASAQRGLSAAQATTARSTSALRSSQDALTAGNDRTAASATRAGQGFERARGQGTRAFAGIGAALGGLGPLIAGAFAVSKVTGFFKEAIQGASDLQQNVGGVEAVMKAGSKAFLGYSKTAATSVGISASEYNQLGTLLGAQLKNGGTATDQLAGKTRDLIKTGADLSAQFGGSASEAVAALSSALKGERDPIERYGVSLNQAKIDAEAASLGFKKVGGSLSTEASQAATLSLIMKQTSDAHGAFARESDTLAHKQQVLNAQWKDGKARLGNALLPAVSAITGALSAGLGPALNIAEKGLTGVTSIVGNFVDGFKNGTDAVGSNQSRLAAVGAAVYLAFSKIGGVAKTAFAGIKSFVGPLLPVFDQLYKTIGPLFLSFAKAYIQVSPLALLFKAIVPVLPQLGQAFAGLAETIVPVLTEIATMLGSTLAQVVPILVPIVQQLAGVFSQVVQAVLPLVPVLAQLISTILPVVIQLIQAIVPVLLPLVQTILNVVIPVIEALLPVITTVFNAIVPIIQAALQIVQGVIQVVTGIISGDWSKAWTGIKNIFGGVWNLIKAIVVGAINIVKSVIGAGIGVVKALWSGAWNAVKLVFSAAWNAITANLKAKVELLVKTVGAIKDRVVSALSGAATWLADVGGDIVAGLKNGISNAWGSVTSLVSGLTDKLPAIVKKALGIHSPSRVFHEIGGFITQGLRNGLLSGASKVQSAMSKVGGIVTSAFNAKEISAGQRDTLNRAIGIATGQLEAIANKRSSVAKKLKTATTSLTKVLKEQADYAKSIASSAISRADVTASVTSGGMIQSLKTQVAQTKLFQKTLSQLRKLGLDKTSYQQFLAKGVDSLGSALGLLDGGKSAIKSVKALQGQLGSAANALGKSASGSLYGAGVQAARGVVDGLKSQRRALAKTMASVAATMVSSIRKALGIHSPSKVFADQVGKFIPAGVERGIDRGRASLDRKVARLAALPQGLDQTAYKQATALSPSLAAQAATGAPAAVVVELHSKGGVAIEDLIDVKIRHNDHKRTMALRTGRQKGK